MGMTIGEEVQGQNQDIVEGLYLSAGEGTSYYPTG